MSLIAESSVARVGCAFAHRFGGIGQRLSINA
jgi:hypothetical protein